MEGAVKCDFDVMSNFIQDENGCYITPVDDHKKIMANFKSSYMMLYTLRTKGYKYNSSTYEFSKDEKRYILWFY
jgi:hypothetical protein